MSDSGMESMSGVNEETPFGGGFRGSMDGNAKAPPEEPAVLDVDQRPVDQRPRAGGDKSSRTNGDATTSQGGLDLLERPKARNPVIPTLPVEKAPKNFAGPSPKAPFPEGMSPRTPRDPLVPSSPQSSMTEEGQSVLPNSLPPDAGRVGGRNKPEETGGGAKKVQSAAGEEPVQIVKEKAAKGVAKEPKTTKKPKAAKVEPKAAKEPPKAAKESSVKELKTAEEKTKPPTKENVIKPSVSEADQRSSPKPPAPASVEVEESRAPTVVAPLKTPLFGSALPPKNTSPSSDGVVGGQNNTSPTSVVPSTPAHDEQTSSSPPPQPKEPASPPPPHTTRQSAPRMSMVTLNTVHLKEMQEEEELERKIGHEQGHQLLGGHLGPRGQPHYLQMPTELLLGVVDEEAAEENSDDSGGIRVEILDHHDPAFQAQLDLDELEEAVELANDSREVAEEIVEEVGFQGSGYREFFRDSVPILGRAGEHVFLLHTDSWRNPQRVLQDSCKSCMQESSSEDDYDFVPTL